MGRVTISAFLRLRRRPRAQTARVDQAGRHLAANGQFDCICPMEY